MGDLLRLRREEKGLTLKDVSQSLYINKDYLKSLEDMYIPGIPKGYLNGLLRAYAEHLGLASEALITDYRAQCGAISRDRTFLGRAAEKPRRFTFLRLLSIGLLIGSVVFVAYFAGTLFFSQVRSQDPDIAANTAQSLTMIGMVRTEPVSQESPPQLPLRIVALRPAHLDVRGTDGTVFRSRMMAEGETYYPRIGAGWLVTTQSGRAFKWVINEIEIGVLADSDAFLTTVSVDDVAQEARTLLTERATDQP